MKATGRLEATEVIRGVHSHAMVILDNDGSNGKGWEQARKGVVHQHKSFILGPQLWLHNRHVKMVVL